jgi:hypothetical protein
VTLNATDIGSKLNGPQRYHGELFQKSTKSKSAHVALTECGTTVSLLLGDLSGTVGNFAGGPNKATPPVVELKGTLIIEDGTSSGVQCSFKGLTLSPHNPGEGSCP